MTEEQMSSKEAVAIIRANYPPSNRVMLREALDLAIKVLEGETVVHLKITSTDAILTELHRRISSDHITPAQEEGEHYV